MEKQLQKHKKLLTDMERLERGEKFSLKEGLKYQKEIDAADVSAEEEVEEELTNEQQQQIAEADSETELHEMAVDLPQHTQQQKLKVLA